MSDTIAIFSEMIDANTALTFTSNNNIESYTQTNVETDGTGNVVSQIEINIISSNIDNSSQVQNFIYSSENATQNSFQTLTFSDPQVLSASNSNIVTVNSTSSGNFITQHTSIYYSSDVSVTPII